MKEMAYGKNFDNTSEKGKKEIKSLEKLISVPKKNIFGARTEDDFDTKLSDMNTEAMQRLCVKVGVPPSGKRIFLRKKLKAAFKKYNSRAKIYTSPNRPLKKD